MQVAVSQWSARSRKRHVRGRTQYRDHARHSIKSEEPRKVYEYWGLGSGEDSYCGNYCNRPAVRGSLLRLTPRSMASRCAHWHCKGARRKLVCAVILAQVHKYLDLEELRCTSNMTPRGVSLECKNRICVAVTSRDADPIRYRIHCLGTLFVSAHVIDLSKNCCCTAF